MSAKNDGEVKRAPPEMIDAVLRWVKTYKSVRRKYVDRHPDWPTVVEWSREFPAKKAEIRALQESVLGIHEMSIKSPTAVTLAFFLFPIRNALASDRKIATAPGGLILRVGHFLLGPGRAKRIIEPLVADVHMEHFAALQEGRHWHARAAVVRGYILALRLLFEPLCAAVRAILSIFRP
jgi:hypothetical protein